MANATQRAITIIDTLVNGVATPAQRQRVLDAYTAQVAVVIPNPTTADVAQAFLAEMRSFVFGRIGGTEDPATLRNARISLEAAFIEGP